MLEQGIQEREMKKDLGVNFPFINKYMLILFELS